MDGLPHVRQHGRRKGFSGGQREDHGAETIDFEKKAPFMISRLAIDVEAHERHRLASYSFRRYARSASRSSAAGRRSKCRPSVVAIGGMTAVGPEKLASTRLKNSM
jgi:hypothetical protein